MISTFFLAMTLYPEFMRRAQVEIDTVIGDERLLTFKDRERLPYVECILEEVHRYAQTFMSFHTDSDLELARSWNPPVPLGERNQVVVEIWSLTQMHAFSSLKGFPHSSMERDEYRGMTIPPGSKVISNIW